jgi:7-keto-8-aminopelargonate synthetase-like enzyme
MARAERFHFSHSRKIDSADRHTSAAAQAGVILQTAQSANGRYVIVDGRSLLNFGSCSYMGLEHRPELCEAAQSALETYGTQFSFSRAYLQNPLYLELEALLERIAGRPVIVTPSTSLGHIAALPVLVRDDDMMVIDQFAHASLQTAVQIMPKVPLEILRHNRMDQLDALLARQRVRGGRVWYILDGLYSMLGDFAPFAELDQLLDRHDNLRLYIDDAHSTSWLGQHGRGAALEYFAHDERVVVALSLNKSFAAAGGALALPDRELAARIRRCGGPMLFSGPVQPPMLGAALGSARLHLSPELPMLQAELVGRVDACANAMAQHGIEPATLARSTIFQAQCDSPRIVYAAASLMQARGYYCCICVFPAVPMNRPGIRFTVTRHNQIDDIEAFAAALADCLAEAKCDYSSRPAALSAAAQ